MAKDLIERIDDLHKQATIERSHFYVGSVLKDCKAELLAKDAEIERQAKLIKSKLRIWL